MFPDGICHVTGKTYSKAVRFDDLTYRLAQPETKDRIFSDWCDFHNSFDPSVHFQISCMNLSTDLTPYQERLHIPRQQNDCDELGKELENVMLAQFSKGNNGLLKTYVESFLMKDGMPWYAATTSAPYMGDKTLDDVKTNRDDRLQLFVFSESNFLPVHSQQTAGTVQYFMPHPVSNRQEMQDRTGYRLRKYASFDLTQNVWGKAESTTGCIIFRGVEAYLNYMEAYYLKNGRIDGKAANYWRAVRERAGVDPDFNKTIAATDMNKETDWAKKSGDETVDATLLNIRRERRCEFIGEDMRYNDLIRWRAMDDMLSKKFIPEGCNFWDELYKVANKDENGAEIEYRYTGSEGSNISDPSFKYLRPYSVMKDNNPVYDGYTWAKANYLSPLPIREIELLSPDENVETSVLYQNPYWPTTINGTAIE